MKEGAVKQDGQGSKSCMRPDHGEKEARQKKREREQESKNRFKYQRGKFIGPEREEKANNQDMGEVRENGFSLKWRRWK